MTSSMLAVICLTAGLLIVWLVRLAWRGACKWYDTLEAGW